MIKFFFVNTFIGELAGAFVIVGFKDDVQGKSGATSLKA
jgi:hypothetical protein